LLALSHQAFSRLCGHVFPQQSLTDDVDFLELVKRFSIDPDAIPEYSRADTSVGVIVAMTMAMPHGECTNWEKVRSYYTNDNDGKAISLKPFIKEAKKFSKILVATIQSEVP
jgi:hypothetical protein